MKKEFLLFDTDHSKTIKFCDQCAPRYKKILFKARIATVTALVVIAIILGNIGKNKDSI